MERAFGIAARIGAAQFGGFIQAQVCRNITVKRIMRARLIGDDVNLNAPLDDLWQHFGAVADEADRDGALLLDRVLADAQRFV